MTTAVPPSSARPGTSGGGATSRRSDRPLTPTARWLSLAAVLLGTAALYLVGLDKSGYANSFYSAAAQAGSKNWKAWFFGSLDAANAITVDKPPASLWVMGLSVRLFGLSSWSILVPEALMGVLTSALTYALVRRIVSNRGDGAPRVAHWTGIFAAGALALTPVATLMFRFNNPDALLVLLVTLAVYGTVRAIERGRAGWLAVAGVAIGFGFLTKMLQAFLILPVLILAYAAFAPVSWKKRLLHLLYAFVALVASCGWYVAIFELAPTSWRPYMGGSQHNSMLELIFGYNGLGRINGQETGSVTGGPRAGSLTERAAGTTGGSRTGTVSNAAGGQMPGGGPGAATGGRGGGMWGQTGLTRMFDGVSGGMVSWLIPAALILAVVGIVLIGRRSRTNLVRAGLVISAGWLVITAGVFSFMAGIYHDYYTVALAPAIAATVAIGAAALWTKRRLLTARIGLAVALAVTAVWTAVLVQRAGGSYAVVGDVAAVVMGLAALVFLFAHRLTRLMAGSLVAAAAVASLAAPASYAFQTASVGHQGSIVTAGPVSGMGGGPGGGAPGRQAGAPGQPGGMTRQGAPGTRSAQGPNGNGAQGSSRTGARTRGTGAVPAGAGQAPGGTGGAAGHGGGMGMLEGMSVSTALKQALETNASSYTWVAATVGSQSAASLQLATGDPVMAIGGFNGSDPSPTLAQFQQYVQQGKIHYFIAGQQGGQQNGGSDAAQQISSWVKSHYKTVTVGGTTVYDLTQPTGK